MNKSISLFFGAGSVAQWLSLPLMRLHGDRLQIYFWIKPLGKLGKPATWID
jgi:hypothetical protein